MRRSTREEAFRHTFSEPIQALFQIIVPGEAASSKGEAKIIDISPGGMKMNTAFHMPEGAADAYDLQISFKLNEEELTYAGSVVWQKDKGSTYDYGIDLTMSEEDEKKLIDELKTFSRNDMLNDE